MYKFQNLGERYLHIAKEVNHTTARYHKSYEHLTNCAKKHNTKLVCDGLSAVMFIVENLTPEMVAKSINGDDSHGKIITCVN